jgi:preprotein translocase subunit SecA
MLGELAYRLSSARRLWRLRPLAARVGRWEAEVRGRSLGELRESAAVFRRRLALGETLDDLLPEAFALVREAARRTLGQRHFDVQILGGAAIHRGWIAEMVTGEGKTLTATLPAFLNALPGRGVHVVTVNDYLARRDAEWMGRVYDALGLTTGCLTSGLPDAQRLAAYRADVTYGTNKEFAFDYLRDQLRQHAARAEARTGKGGVFERQGAPSSDSRSQTSGPFRVQREHYFAIVDEVDSILIDEARVPLIISSREAEESPYAPAYRFARQLALGLTEGRDYTVERVKYRAELTNVGIARVRTTWASGAGQKSNGRMPGVRSAEGGTPDALPPNRPIEHLVQQALRAEYLYERDREYLIVDGKVAIVDEFTGRILPDRTWSLGLHQAVEAKEEACADGRTPDGAPAVKITDENRTLASVTFQRYFKMYRKLAGMTGTAHQARREFRKVYHLSVASIPTNQRLVRKGLPHRVFATWEDKYDAIIARILDLHGAGRPVLVGTRSVRRSEELARRMQALGWFWAYGREDPPAPPGKNQPRAPKSGHAPPLLDPTGPDADSRPAFTVLNARNHAEEAQIIARAGERGRVTISTNMAGRGVDILLGEGVAALGGLHVLGTELHEARRIDHQLGGRAGRQGDPGSFEFFLSLEDELLSRWHKRLAARLARRATRRRRPSAAPPQPLSGLYVLLLQAAQRWIERRHLRIRLDLIEYDKHLEEMKGNLGVPLWG